MVSSTNPSDLRREIDAAVESSPALAASRLRQFWKNQSDLSAAMFVCGRFEKLRGKLSLTPQRLFLLRSFTVEPIVPLLRAGAFCLGIDLSVQIGDFNAYSQEILDPDSSLYKFSPDAVVLAVRTADLAPDLWTQSSDLTGGELETAAQRVAATLQRCIHAFRERSSAALIVHNLEQPEISSSGVLDVQGTSSQGEAIRQVNRELSRLAHECRGVYMLDYDGLVARHGRERWMDERKFLTARLPVASENLLYLSQEWLRFLVPLSGRIAKAAVVDLDNTLWGGVIGEDGMNGIQLGPEYPGAAYQAFQRALLDLTRRGVLLAICSKNNPDDAMEVLEKHAGMLLRPKDFAAMRINWNDKAQNLREIAAELNIGIDTFAFIDDNPVECEHVRLALPEVMVIDLPQDPFAYARVIRNCPVFERLALSSEDAQRTALYVAQRERSKEQQQFQSKEDFYRYLEQEVEIAPLSAETLARIAQLTQKTNQFNLTTKRYTEQQISELSEAPGWRVLSTRVRDRYGDQGLVGVSITHDVGNVCEVDTFLLSCRVIGRAVETALLSAIASQAQQRGISRLSGYFLPSKKNAPAQDFYARHGFARAPHNGEGSLWTLDLLQQQISCPDWIRVTHKNGVKH